MQKTKTDKIKCLILDIDRHIWLISVIGILVLAAKCFIVYPVQHVGESDASGYAEMADSLSHGRWLSVEYISFFFIKYAGIPRPEDHWPPLYSFLIAPLYFLFGKHAFVSKLPSLIISSLCLPIASYSLTKCFSRNKWASMGSALMVMFYPSMFMWSLYCLSDITYAFVLCLAVLFAVKGLDRTPYFYLMGFFLGIGYYGKGVTLVLVPAFPLFFLIVRKNLKAFWIDKRFVFGILLAIFIISLWWVRNLILYGDLLHSTQNFWSGYIGYGKGSSYHVYWDEELKPSFWTTKLPLGISHVVKKTKEHLDTNLEWIFLVMYPNPGADPPINLKYFLTLQPIRICLKDFPNYPSGIPIGFLGIPALIGLFFLRRNRKIYIVPLVVGALVLFLSVFWAPIDRLVLPTVPLVASLGWASYSDFLGKFSRWNPDEKGSVKAVVLAFFAVLMLVYNVNANIRLWQQSIREGKYPYVDSQRKKNRIVGAHWIRDNTPPEAIIMDAEPWDLHFYSDRKTVHIPYDSVERILLVMQTYGVTHITYNGQESLKPLYDNQIEGFELINEKGLRVYRVHYDLLTDSHNP